MAKAVNKNMGIVLAGLLCGLFWAFPLPLPELLPFDAPVRSAVAAAPLPYTMTAALLRAAPGDAARLPGHAGTAATLFLAVTTTPREPGVSLYASKSQAQGKVTEIGVATDGKAVPSRVIFPKGVEKPDPLTPGANTRMFDGPFTALVPLPDSVLAATVPAGKILETRLTGLACSAVNCTPLVLTHTLTLPDSAPDALPDAASAPWWDAALSGVAEPMGETPRATLAAPSRFGVMPLPLAKPNGAFINAITPRPFTPGLEVTFLGKAVLLGFLAGIILNLMPCVLPVLGIKLAALLGHGGGTPEGLRRFRRHQVFFALGIMAWFMVMAGLFHFFDLAWGQIFQSPAVVFGLAVLLLLLALNLFGVCTLPVIDLRAHKATNPDIRAFVEGFGATLLATPCGGPLLGGVLSWALMQPLGVLALTLACVGLGMAFPYLLLAAFPGLATRLPRPGEWMHTMEQVLGFLLLGTVAYLVSFLPSEIMARVVASLVLAAFGGWLWQRTLPARLLGIACIIAACAWPFMAQPIVGGWTGYSHAAFAKVLGKRTILVDFTADWCPTCKVVEATALRESNRRAWEKQYDLALFRVDMTQENPEGEALLRAVGSVSIPVVAVFPAGDGALSPLVLRDIVTAGQVEAALEAAN